jgi:hypothetical protein
MQNIAGEALRRIEELTEQLKMSHEEFDGMFSIEIRDPSSPDSGVRVVDKPPIETEKRRQATDLMCRLAAQ